MRMFAATLIVVIAVGSVGFDAAHSQGNEIPEWIKSVAGFWVEDRITDSEFIGALEFLIEQGIIHVDDSQKIQELEKENADLRQRIEAINVEDEIDNPAADVTRAGYTGAKIEVVAKDSPVDFVRIFLADSDKLSTKELIDYVTMTDWRSESEEGKTLLGMEEKLLHAMTVGRLSDSEKAAVMKMLDNASWNSGTYSKEQKEKMAVTKMLDNARVKPMYDVSYDQLVRRNLDHVGDDFFIDGIVLDAVDRSGDANLYELHVSADKINLVPQDNDAFVMISYAGPRILAGDHVRVVGTITGLEIRDKDYLDIKTTIRIESWNNTTSTEKKGSLAGEGTQLPIPVISASFMQILKNPTEMDSVMLKDAALEVPYSLLKEYPKTLEGSLVYYEGSVSSIKKYSDGNLREFGLNVNPLPYESDVIKFRNQYGTTVLPQSGDKVGVYGVFTSYVNQGSPVVRVLDVILK